MTLDRSILKQFAKVTNDAAIDTNGGYVKATVRLVGDKPFVKIDGSSELTPVTGVVDAQNDDRVLVNLTNHKAVIVGNFTFPPSARKEQEAADNANISLNQANLSMQLAEAASEKAISAVGDAGKASALASQAKQESSEAIQAANAAAQNASEAKANSLQSQQDAANALTKAGEAKNEVASARNEINRIDNALGEAKTEINTALGELDTQAAEIEGLTNKLETEYSKKTEVSEIQANLSSEISQKVGELQSTVEKDYALKNELTEAEASLQTQITQNSENITLHAGKIEKVESDTTQAQQDVAAALTKANEAKDAATAAQNGADAAQDAADQAKANATAAQNKATSAQNLAEAAQAAANSADLKVQAAQGDLALAKENLISVQNRVDATEEEIRNAQSQVTAAQESVNQALADAAEAALAASNAQTAADKAKQDAANAQADATTAQTKADNAKRQAEEAKAAAEKAQEDVAALTSRVTQAETDIQQNANQIALIASKTEEIGRNMEDLSVGGRNYILQSRDEQIGTDMDGAILWSTWDVTKFYDENGADAVGVLSFDAYSPTGGSIRVYTQNNYTEGTTKYVTDKHDINLTTEWVRYRVNLSVSSTNSSGKKSLLRFHSGDKSANPHIRKVKLEKGTMATDWTPAPEDASLESVSIGARNYILGSATEYPKTASGARSVYTEYDVSPFYDEFGSDAKPILSFEVYCEESPATFMIYTQNTSADGTTEYSSKQYTLEYNAAWKYQRFVIPNFEIETVNDGGTVSKICLFGSTDATKLKIRKPKLENGNTATDWTPAPEDAENKIGDIVENLSTNYYKKTETDARIDEKADSITSTVTSKITTEIGNLKLGGRNLLPHTNNPTSQNGWMNAGDWSLTNETYNGLKVFSRSDAWSGLQHSYIVEAGEVYTYSVYCKSSSTSPISAYFFLTRSGGAEVSPGSAQVFLDTVWTRHSVTFTANTSGAVSCRLERSEESDATIYVCGMKLEKGNKATDWTPHEDDAINDLYIGGRNLFEKSAKLTQYFIGHAGDGVNPTDFTTGVDTSVPSGQYLKFTVSNPNGGGFFFGSDDNGANYRQKLVAGETYTISVYVKITGDTDYSVGYFGVEFLSNVTQSYVPNYSSNWQQYVITGVCRDDPSNNHHALIFYPPSGTFNESEVYISSPKIEQGNKVTDWTPAPEDAVVMIEEAESKITQLANSISTLVRDGNGQSLMTQTSTGWAFEITPINNSLNNLGSVADTVGDLMNYVKITTYDGKPCIMLGASNSPFKVVITNEEIKFMQNNNSPAYLNNQTLYVQRAEVEGFGEIQQGNWAWGMRPGGNYGLMWKG